MEKGSTAVEPDHLKALRLLLVARAGAGGTITYRRLRHELGFAGDLVPLLRALSEAEDEAGRGLLTALVVDERTGRPGAGWFRLAAERGRDLSEPDMCWRDEVQLLFDHWSATGGI
jgi:hypothetical protein